MNTRDIPILMNPVLPGDQARERGLVWAERTALLSHEQARAALQAVPTEIPEQWVEEAIRDALEAHQDAILHSALSRLQLRCLQAGKTLKPQEDHGQEL